MGAIYISEILPNPVGKDTQGEFIELANASDQAVMLQGWSLKDVSGKEYHIQNQSMPAHGFFVLPYTKTKISLNNDTDVITLFDQSGAIQDVLSYQGSVPEGVSLIVSGTESAPRQTATPTPGEANKEEVPETSQEQVWDYGFTNEETRKEQNFVSSQTQEAQLSGMIVSKNTIGESVLAAVVIAIVLAILFWWGYSYISSKEGKEKTFSDDK